MTHRARKRFGQNFLHDESVIYNILAAIDARPNQHLVEIGPGPGALTASLLDSGAALDIVELDRDLVALLRRKFQHSDKLRIHSADALQFDFCRLTTATQQLRIIGNLPYNISTPLLFHLLENIACIEDMHFMLQKELVDRLCAGPGSKRYGRLSLMVQYHCTAERLFEVPPESFEPPPKVMSAVIRLTPHPEPPVAIDDLEDFRQIVTQAFSQRRKTLRNPLKKLLSAGEIASLGIDPGLRAEALSLQEFAALSNLWTKKRQT